MHKEALQSLKIRIDQAIHEKKWQYPELNYHYNAFIKQLVQEVMRKFYHKQADGEENRRCYKDAATLIAKHEWAVKNKGLALEIMKATTLQNEQETADYEAFKSHFIENFITTYYDAEASTMKECLETADLMAVHEWLTEYDDIRASHILNAGCFDRNRSAARLPQP